VNFWLLKSEPETWSWADQTAKGRERWDGVRNHQAARHLKAMRKGDRAFFYHSGAERRIVGLVRVVREAFPDPTDPTGRFVAIDIETEGALAQPVTLAAIKADPALAHLGLVRQSRLSVMPIDAPAWRRIGAMGGG
jgi:predicted RNA-binding protein with PUA-like domain